MAKTAKSQILILAEFLMTNFGEAVGFGAEVPCEDVVATTVRLLGELREERRQALKLLDMARAELERRRQRIKILTSELVEAIQLIGPLRKEGCTGRRT